MRERGQRPEPAQFEDIPPPPAPGPIDWWLLSPQERVEHLKELQPFVVKLTKSYRVPEAEIPRCWYKHELLIQEILALYQYREQVQFDEGASAQGPIDFFYNLHFSVRPRLRAAHSCNAAKHAPDEDEYPSWVEPMGLAQWRANFDDYLNTYLV